MEKWEALQKIVIEIQFTFIKVVVSYVYSSVNIHKVNIPL